MRHLAIILALLTAACAPAAMDGTRTYGSQQATDAALAAFGRDNYVDQLAIALLAAPACRTALRNAFLGLTWRRIFFRHGEGLFMTDASGEGSIIELI
jgi:hypothetical protein